MQWRPVELCNHVQQSDGWPLNVHRRNARGFRPADICLLVVAGKEALCGGNARGLQSCFKHAAVRLSRPNFA
jgi:hypothetical protein